MQSTSMLIKCLDKPLPLNKKIDIGISASVYESEFENQKVAVKVSNPSDHESYIWLKKELKIFQEITLFPKNEDSKYLITCFAYCIVPKNTITSYTQTSLILEYSSLGNLIFFLKKDPNKDWNVAYPLMKHALKGLGYMHQNGLSHNDVKGENMLIFAENNQYVLKLNDFAYSHPIGKLDTCGGTFTHMAPELFLLSSQFYTVTTKTDIFSFGMVINETNFEINCKKNRAGFSTDEQIRAESSALIEMFWHEDLRNEDTISGFYRSGNRIPIQNTCPPKIKHLIEWCCWKKDPQDRPDAKDLLEQLEPNIDEISNELIRYSAIP